MGFQAEASINKETWKQEITQLCAETSKHLKYHRNIRSGERHKEESWGYRIFHNFPRKPGIPYQWKGFPKAQNLICCNRSTLAYTSVYLCLITFKRSIMTLHSSVVKAKKKSKYYHSVQYVPVHSWKDHQICLV